MHLVFFGIFHTDIGQLADSDTGLEKELDDGGNSDVQSGGVP